MSGAVDLAVEIARHVFRRFKKKQAEAESPEHDRQEAEIDASNLDQQAVAKRWNFLRRQRRGDGDVA